MWSRIARAVVNGQNMLHPRILARKPRNATTMRLSWDLIFLGEAIRRRREFAGSTQHRLANRVGCVRLVPRHVGMGNEVASKFSSRLPRPYLAPRDSMDEAVLEVIRRGLAGRLGNVFRPFDEWDRRAFHRIRRVFSAPTCKHAELLTSDESR